VELSGEVSLQTGAPPGCWFGYSVCPFCASNGTWGRRFLKWKVLATKPGWRNWHPNVMRLGPGRLMRLGPSALDATNSNSG